jgi:group I intron endonuclease
MATSPFFGEIYVHTNLLNGKSYVGQTSRSMSERWAEHIKERRNRAFSNALRKYGTSNFLSQVVSTASLQAELDSLERVWVILLQTKTPNGYNLTCGGEAGTLGYRHTPEALLRIANASAGRIMSPESRAKLSAAKKGVKRSPEAIEASAAAKRGQPHILSPEGRDAVSRGVSAALTGVPKSQNHREKLRAAQVGKKQSPERKANTSRVMQAWWDARKAI